MKYQVHTFGCKVNTYDTGLIQKNLKENGFELSRENSRIHVLNTCAVTAEATKEAVRQIRRLKVKDPFCTVVVTGCAAQVDTKSFENLPGADLVVANSHKGLLPQILDQYFKGEIKEKIFKSNIFRKEDLEMGGGEESEHTRSFLKIQDGCNQFCSYCIIPYARGKSRSIAVKDLVYRVRELYSQGVREVVLTGVHIGDYLDESNQAVLEDLVQALLEKTEMPRFRLSSLEPIEISEKLLKLYENSRLCPHFHMSIQSAESEVLRLMKRKYGQQEVREALLKIKQKIPQAFIGMDVIVGFPTETDEQFEETYKALSELPWSRIHVFPYSERSGTKAEILEPAVPREKRMSRAQKLRDLSFHRYQTEAVSQVGSKKEVLVLKKISKGAHGVSRDYWPVFIETESDLNKLAGQEVSVQIIGYDTPEKDFPEGRLRARFLS